MHTIPLVEHSKTENSHASKLSRSYLKMEDGKLVQYILKCLKKGFTAMANVLLQDERVTIKDII
jgi:hypothetical protein